MIALKQILVASDFSDSAASAVHYAAALGEAFKAELVGCHILEPTHDILAAVTGELHSTDVRASQAREAMENLLIDAGVNHFRVLVEMGNPSAEVVRMAKNEDVDLIVVSTHGRSGMAHMLLGSTAENIIRLAPCPVLVVRDGAHDFIHPS